MRVNVILDTRLFLWNPKAEKVEMESVLSIVMDSIGLLQIES